MLRTKRVLMYYLMGVSMDRKLKVIGFVVTAIYVLLISWLLVPKFNGLACLELNELGDFLAGVFGPLSLFWLILGFFQQGYELQQNNQSLRQQAEELRASVEQQKELVSVSKSHHEAIEANARLEHERLAMSLEPRFAMRFVRSDVVENGRVFILELTNGGHAITCVRVIVGSSSYEYPFLDSRQALEISHYHEPVRELCLDIYVSYLNGLEIMKTRKFIIFLKKNLAEEVWKVELELPNGVSVQQ